MKTGYDKFFSEVKKNKSTAAQPLSSRPTQTSARRPVIPRKNKVRAPFPLQLFVTLTLGIALAGLGWYKQDSVLKFIEAFEVELFGAAIAEDAKEKAPAAEAKDAKEVAKAAEPNQDDPAYLKKLVDRKQELDAREAELSKMEEEIRQQREVLDQRIKELESIRAQIGEVLKEKVEMDSSRVEKLVEFYSNMKPQQAAKIMETLDEDLAVETLGRMKKKNAADIMNLLEAKKAQSISEKFAGYRRK
jgi:flagellar motility protein MotE (MotC chaperone)